MATALSSHPPAFSDARMRAWRWHFLAAILVVPFVLWQSVTGTIYLWSQAWVDARHPELRFVEASDARASLDEQVRVAREALQGARIANVLIPSDATRSTQFIFDLPQGLPAALFVDPHSGKLLGRLEAIDWPYGWSRKLHGGWPLGLPGDWLLELGACWTIVMVLTGLYLWWPRERSLIQVLLPRFNAGARVLWRDLHACVAVWLSLVIVLFLFTALPWTGFWGDNVLRPIQQALAQEPPQAARFAPFFVEGDRGDGSFASLQAMLDAARARGVRGDITLQLLDGPPAAALAMRGTMARTSDERYVLFDRHNGQAVSEAGWNDFPPLAKAVATGVDLHEGSYFGALGPWINTVFAASMIWLSVTGFMAWWKRKPQGGLGAPRAGNGPWPRWWKPVAALLFIALPLFTLSALVVWLGEWGWRRTRGVAAA